MVDPLFTAYRFSTFFLRQKDGEISDLSFLQVSEV